MDRPMRRDTKRRRKQGMPGWYKAVIILICVIGTVFLVERAKELWLVHVDMEQTLEQEKTLTAEKDMLEKRKAALQEPQEIERQAREQFGLARPGEIPYKR